MPFIAGTRVTASQEEVYNVLSSYGPLPDHALVPLAQHVMKLRQSSSGIRTRRRELVNLGLAQSVGTTTTGAGRTAEIYKAV